MRKIDVRYIDTSQVSSGRFKSVLSNLQPIDWLLIGLSLLAIVLIAVAWDMAYMLLQSIFYGV